MCAAEVVLFESADGAVTLPVEVERETVWLSAEQMSALFDRDTSVIRRHVNNVFSDKELVRGTNVQLLHVASADKPVAFYSLDVIISVGYRVKSQRGVEFRRWATDVLQPFNSGDKCILPVYRHESAFREVAIGLMPMRLYALYCAFVGFDQLPKGPTGAMNASISLLLDGIGARDAKVLDYRESFDETPFDVSCVQRLVYPITSALDPGVLYVADKAAITYMAGNLQGMSMAFAGEMPAAEAFAPVEQCRVVCIPEYENAKGLLNALIGAQRALDDLDARLIWASLEKDPLGAMLSILAEHLHEPLLAIDADDVLVASAIPEGLDVLDGAFRHIIDHNCIISDAPVLNDLLSAIPSAGMLRSTVPLVRIPGTDREYLSAAVLRDGGPLLNILMSNEGCPFKLSYRDVLLRVKLLIERAVLAGSPLGFPPPESDSCVRRLLDHIFVREEIIEGYLRKRGWHMYDRFYCVLAQIEAANSDAKLSFLARQLRSGIMRDAVVLVHGPEVACVVRADECPYDIARLSTELGSIAGRFGARMGVSCPFHDFRELRRYYDSCRTAISYGEQENPPRSVSFFDDYAARHLEHVLFNRSINEVLLDARASDIKRYDDEHDQSLLQTLLVYLECGQNKTLASKQLFIHRNTLVYRIGLIEKVAGIDLSALDADRLFHLMYTCRYLLSRG